MRALRYNRGFGGGAVGIAVLLAACGGKQESQPTSTTIQVKGSDTMAIFSGAKHPIAAHLFINHMLDAEISAANTNYIYYMGPNAAAKEFISPDILADPALNPDQELVAKLEELLDLGPAVRYEYQKRWRTLRGG